MATTVSIQLKTEVPGPQSRAILDRKERVIAEPLGIYLPLVIAEGHGAVLTDVDGNSFLDFTGGIGCLAVGHSHPKVVEAAQEQAALFTHTDFTIVPYENYISLAERLAAITPISGELRAGFFNSGAESVENAVKIAKKYTKRPAVIAFDGAFHGRTLMAMSLTSKPHPYKAGFGPFAPEVYRVSFSDSYRGPDTATALAELRRAFKTRVAAEEVAAIIFEPVQGESGFVTRAEGLRPGRARDRQRARDRADRRRGADRLRPHRDDVRDRAVRHRARPHDGRQVDRRRLAAVRASSAARRSWTRRRTRRSAAPTSATPSRIAAAHAVLDIIEEEQLVERAAEIGDRTRARMHEWQEKFSCIGDVRGLGMMLAIEIVSDREAKTPDAALATAIQEAAAARGVLLLKAGLYGNCIRVLCPLVITDEQLEEALGAWEAAIEAATSS